MKLKIIDNLYLIDDRIVSYTTVVGRLTSTGIVVNGKYSRTTTKHINRVSYETGLNVMYQSTQQKWFSWYQDGVKTSMEGTLSRAASGKILKEMRDRGCGLIEASIAVLSKLKGRDLQQCKQQLLESGVNDEQIEHITILSELGLID